MAAGKRYLSIFMFFDPPASIKQPTRTLDTSIKCGTFRYFFSVSEDQGTPKMTLHMTSNVNQSPANTVRANSLKKIHGITYTNGTCSWLAPSFHPEQFHLNYRLPDEVPCKVARSFAE
jgi:hypothetical protein